MCVCVCVCVFMRTYEEWLRVWSQVIGMIEADFLRLKITYVVIVANECFELVLI